MPSGDSNPQGRKAAVREVSSQMIIAGIEWFMGKCKNRKEHHCEIPRKIGICRFGRVLDVSWHVGGGVVFAAGSAG